MTQALPPPAWAHLPFFTRDWPAIRDRLRGMDWLPGPGRVFAALDAVRPQDVRVVILGQDPYPTPGHANALANIFSELETDTGARPPSGDLTRWARQGVLLLNTSLSVVPGRAGAHADWGWDRLAREAIAEAQSHGPLAFVLWGAHAARVARGLPRPQDLVIESPHPSPLSARRGFFGSRPFSRVNEWLVAQGRDPIDWSG